MLRENNVTLDTPSVIVYCAWENTPKPLLYNTSDGKKNITKEVVFIRL